MHLELRHLRTVEAIHETGSLAAAAARLGLTQSALSHQIRSLEEGAGVPVLVRATRPLRLSPAGLRLLAAARAVLPQIAALEADLGGLRRGRAGRMHVAVECHACFEWLLPVLDRFRRAWPEVDIDIRAGLAFDALAALRREEVDLVISSDPGGEGLSYAPLFDYAPVLVAAEDHPLAAREAVEAADFRGQTLLTYPVERTRLDVFTELLGPAGVEPAAIRPVELTAMILLLVAAGRGVAVLPDWVVRGAGREGLAVRPLRRDGRPVTRRLFAATRESDAARPFVAHLVRLAREEALRHGRP
ncbi:LysR family transcriptional regulator [Rubellimicrobium sp. CFH 75288]|uniref:LysR family transcriptional regulator n=1 Tax=Rubellimicrobium sp. CFH 75288 TaxID=2697034 RepID=UPI00144EE04D|nr:LysR family transcriptional regulator [Rubellimicrobium sp. CFH 75288]NAZ38320.1 LysR family transcriptional regulator [Rubellimicrobium sp. CFH 75288]